jgi:transposase
LTVNTGSGTATRPDAAAWSAYRRACRYEQPNRAASSRAASAAGTPACFSKLRQFRAVATRYDKRERIYQGTIDVASISIWLRDPVP